MKYIIIMLMTLLVLSCTRLYVEVDTFYKKNTPIDANIKKSSFAKMMTQLNYLEPEIKQSINEIETSIIPAIHRIYEGYAIGIPKESLGKKNLFLTQFGMTKETGTNVRDNIITLFKEKIDLSDDIEIQNILGEQDQWFIIGSKDKETKVYYAKKEKDHFIAFKSDFLSSLSKLYKHQEISNKEKKESIEKFIKEFKLSDDIEISYKDQKWTITTLITEEDGNQSNAVFDITINVEENFFLIEYISDYLKKIAIEEAEKSKENLSEFVKPIKKEIDNLTNDINFYLSFDYTNEINSTPFLLLSDVKHPKNFVKKLKKFGSDNLSFFSDLKSEFSEETKTLFEKYKESTQPEKLLLVNIINNINNLLSTKDFYKEYVVNFYTNEKIEKLLRKQRNDDMLILLNRLLLEEFFSSEIRKVRIQEVFSHDQIRGEIRHLINSRSEKLETYIQKLKKTVNFYIAAKQGENRSEEIDYKQLEKIELLVKRLEEQTEKLILKTKFFEAIKKTMNETTGEYSTTVGGSDPNIAILTSPKYEKNWHKTANWAYGMGALGKTEIIITQKNLIDYRVKMLKNDISQTVQGTSAGLQETVRTFAAIYGVPLARNPGATDSQDINLKSAIEFQNTANLNTERIKQIHSLENSIGERIRALIELYNSSSPEKKKDIDGQIKGLLKNVINHLQAITNSAEKK